MKNVRKYGSKRMKILCQPLTKTKKILFITLYHPQKPKKEFQNLSKLLKGPSLGSEYFHVAFLC